MLHKRTHAIEKLLSYATLLQGWLLRVGLQRMRFDCFFRRMLIRISVSCMALIRSHHHRFALKKAFPTFLPV